MTETPNQRRRRYQRVYSETVLSLVSEMKQPPALVSDLARKRVSDQWVAEFGPTMTQDWFPEQAKEN